jgi:polyphenol oxidase
VIVNLSADRPLEGSSHIPYHGIGPPGLVAVISLKYFWDTAESQDRGFLRRKLLREIGYAGHPLASAGQVHGSQIVAVGSPGDITGVDGLVTDIRNLFLAIVVADCLPIFIWDLNGGWIGLIHAGWRGSTAQIVKKSVALLHHKYGADPAQIGALLGPGICLACYEIGPEVATNFQTPNLIPGRGDRFHLDLRAVNRRQLLEVGVADEHIITDELCPCCRNDLLCSYRAHGPKAGRMIATMGLTK